MKIKNISCTQFAGVRDRNISFTDGINVIYGKNESGKSTLVNLLSRTLFQAARLDRRRDKDFFELYFPAAGKDSRITGDFADGKLTFETDLGTYTLSKEWGSDARCTLSTPDGVLRDQSKIDAVLKEILLYGEGVFSEMLFPSQRNADAALQTLLDASKKTDAKQEITDAVSRAFAESDGISVDAIEQAIAAKTDEIAGKHWDFDRKAPIRKPGGGRWSKDLGEILKAYYAFEDARAVLEEISRLENEADRTAQEYTQQDLAARNAEKAYDEFNEFSGRLTLQSEQKKSIARLEQDLEKAEAILSDWPAVTQALDQARTLRTEKADRALLDQYEAAKKLRDELAAMTADTASRPCPGEAEIMQVRTAQRSMDALENKLCGMNLNAAIQMLKDDRIEILSLRTGEPVALSEGTASITEAVKITVPGVMEMQLSPADIDVTAIESQITQQKHRINEIFAKYGVESLDGLESLAKNIADAKAKIDAAGIRFTMLLGETTFETLETAAKSITAAVRSKEAIERDILTACASKDIERFITAKETVIAGYTAEHASIRDLKAKAFDLKSELEKEKGSLSAAEDIPAEYLGISDPEAHLKALRRRLEDKRVLREKAFAAKADAASRLESRQAALSGDPAQEAERARRAFEEQKSLLTHWRHIAEVFMAQKEKLKNNPMQDIADRFTRYLGRISDGRVSSEFPEADKLNMNIYSENKLLDYSKLSEGTKDTVSLAFRLAVLDHLFPEGGGVIVFDDPFTDMDAERTAQSCELIRECAKRHQVIFLTCKEDYLDVLAGNHIFF